ncbi:MAG: hypothetical protein HW421_1225 [Ignavibacteria bacterium]|nr:hypothetical protein [Ignavibacteria bacterium]
MTEPTTEKKETWTTFLAITTVLIAVCATLSTFKGGGYSTRALMNQTKASDQWAFYQSKSVKGYIFEMQKDKLEMELQDIQHTSKNTVQITDYEKKIEAYSKKIKKYDEEKEQIKKDARAFEQISEDAKIHSEVFGIAVIYLQVSILLSSISALTKKKFVWYISLALGAFGILYFFNGFFIFF